MSTRVLRSRSRGQPSEISQPALVAVAKRSYQLTQHAAKQLTTLPEVLTLKMTGFSRADLDILKLKRQKLRSPTSQTARSINSLQDAPGPSVKLTAAARATLVFGQHAAGTAVCISTSGLLLTCAHCLADSQEEFEAKTPHWLIFSSGRVVKAECIVWNPKKDLALLQIVALERMPGEAAVLEESFPFVTISANAPTRKRFELLCIGGPGSEDLEAAPTESGPKATNYDVLHFSSGRFRGLALGQDVQNNSEIGALMHDCWTYWGHSGAPLVDAKTGELVGLHSSWDDETAMRRGIAWEAIDAFLGEWWTFVRTA